MSNRFFSICCERNFNGGSTKNFFFQRQIKRGVSDADNNYHFVFRLLLALFNDRRPTANPLEMAA